MHDYERLVYEKGIFPLSLIYLIRLNMKWRALTANNSQGKHP